jgi:hypothetical protein
MQNAQPLASAVVVKQRKQSRIPAPAEVVVPPMAQKRSNLLELEFDPDILAVAAEQDGTNPIQMEEPEKFIIQDFVPISLPKPTPRPRRVQAAVDRGASTLVMPFEFRTLTNPYIQHGSMLSSYNQSGWRVALIGGLLLLVILVFIIVALMAF